MIEIHAFERLALTVEMIATHRDFSGKQRMVRECLRELDERREGGRLTFEQWAKLVARLMPGMFLPRATGGAAGERPVGPLRNGE